MNAIEEHWAAGKPLQAGPRVGRPGETKDALLEQPISELVGVPGWISSVAVGDDFAVMLVSELDGPSSLWRATTR